MAKDKKRGMPTQRKGADDRSKKKKKNMGSAVNKIDIKAVAKKQQKAKRVALSAQDKRVRQEHKEDRAPTTERTKARASTTGRTRTQRSTINMKGELNTPEMKVKLRTGGVGFFAQDSSPYALRTGNYGTATLSHYGDSVGKPAPHITSPTLPTRAGSGAGRGTSPRYEGTPNTAETEFEAIPAPERKQKELIR